MVNNIAPLKTAGIKNTTHEWFEREIAEKLSIRDKLFKKIQIKPFQHRLGNHKETRRLKNNQTEEKTVS